MRFIFMHCLLIKKKIKVKKNKIYDALVAEGLDNILDKYFNLHLLPMYQKKFAYGNKGFPWTADFARKNINYKKGICPNAEKLNKEKLILLELCVHEYSEKEVDLVIKCFEKVWSNLKYLKK